MPPPPSLPSASPSPPQPVSPSPGVVNRPPGAGNSPPGAGNSPPGTGNSPPNRRHKVQSGDTLSRIAVTYGTSVADLQRANGLAGTSLSVGSFLKLPGDANSRIHTPPVNPPHRPSRHVVQPGDTLSGIAVKYGTTVAAIQSANEVLDAGRLSVGMVLALTPISSPSPAH
eukprot:1180829-Prorocentrum_minimum.AAC.6